MEYNYYLTYKRRPKQSELYFNIGGQDKTTTLLRLKGRNTSKIFERVLSILGRAGCITPIETGNPSTYWIRDDVGPVLGTYLILIRRCKNTEYWLNFLEELLTGKYSRLGSMFTDLLESAIELSKGKVKGEKQAYALSENIISPLSSALKTFIRSLQKYEK